ncbi:hypothetical protein GL267_008570 [Acidithiobacillus ferrianus]|uniref:Uncharacterized protein n=2 Tax=Acidithiobacillus ferrianus TaxID=2678518 RepID=A0A845UMI0_9PROT|nr:hypothetical protein [Acidithiobacillus ferrianus]NDU42808.1 hypothetical protein [Acidithiobacillus ferrianus]
MAGEELITFTPDLRIKTCFHEAAHAIIHGLHPFCHVYSLAVAPEGTKEGEWEYRHRKGGVSTDIWGVCRTSDTNLLIRWFVRWDRDEGCYVISDDDAVAHYSEPSAFTRSARIRHIRAYCCGLLAGQTAELILDCDGTDDSIWLDVDSDQRGSDMAKVAGLIKLLPYRNELGFLIEKTEESLRDPKIWQMVADLAQALARRGRMEDDEIDSYLPSPRKNWPGSPRPRIPARWFKRRTGDLA